MGKVFVYFFYFQSIFSSSKIASFVSFFSVFINLDEADFHKLFLSSFLCVQQRQRRRQRQSSTERRGNSLKVSLKWFQIAFSPSNFFFELHSKSALNKQFFFSLSHSHSPLHPLSFIILSSVITKVWLSHSRRFVIKKKFHARRKKITFCFTLLFSVGGSKKFP